MRDKSYKPFFIRFRQTLKLQILVVIVLLNGCVWLDPRPPIQEMSDARQAVQAASEVDAETLVGVRFKRAQGWLTSAESQYGAGYYIQARFNALRAKETAIETRKFAVIMGDVLRTAEKAKSINAISVTTQGLIERAQASALADDLDNAGRLATEAKRMLDWEIEQAQKSADAEAGSKQIQTP